MELQRASRDRRENVCVEKGSASQRYGIVSEIFSCRFRQTRNKNRPPLINNKIIVVIFSFLFFPFNSQVRTVHYCLVILSAFCAVGGKRAVGTQLLYLPWLALFLVSVRCCLEGGRLGTLRRSWVDLTLSHPCYIQLLTTFPTLPFWTPRLTLLQNSSSPQGGRLRKPRHFREAHIISLSLTSHGRLSPGATYLPNTRCIPPISTTTTTPPTITTHPSKNKASQT